MGINLAATASSAAALARRVAVLGAAGSIWLWWLAAHPLRFGSWIEGTVWTAALLALLLAPAVMLLSAVALAAVANLPARARDALGRAGAGSRDVAASVRAVESPGKKTWMIARRTYRLWKLLLEEKNALLAYTSLARLLNPLSIVIVSAAAVWCLLMAALGAAALVWVRLTIS